MHEVRCNWGSGALRCVPRWWDLLTLLDLGLVRILLVLEEALACDPRTKHELPLHVRVEKIGQKQNLRVTLLSSYA